jgi:MFS family permease
VSRPGHDPWAAVRRPDYRRFLIAHFATTLGIQVQDLIVAWQMYLDTHDALSLGLVGLAEALPVILISMFGGHVADRMDRRRLALISTWILLGCSLVLAYLAGLTGPAVHYRVAGVYVMLAVIGTCRAFLGPARTALAASMIPRALQPNAVTWRSITWQLGAVIGPAVGGVLNAAIGARGSYLVESALLIVGLIGLTAITFRAIPQRDDGESLWHSLVAGLRYFRSQQVLLAAVTLDLLSVLFGGAVALLPIFVVDILHSGPSGLGLLRAAPAVGAVLMSMYLAWRPPFARAGRALLRAVAVFGAATIGFGLARAMWLSFAFLVITGAADMISVVVRATLLQLLVPDRLMGRVSAVNSIFVGSSNEIGGFESGVTAKLFHAVPAVLLGGALTLATVGGTAWLAPALRKVGRLDQLGKELEQQPA